MSRAFVRSLASEGIWYQLWPYPLLQLPSPGGCFAPRPRPLRTHTRSLPLLHLPGMQPPSWPTFICSWGHARCGGTSKCIQLGQGLNSSGSTGDGGAVTQPWSSGRLLSGDSTSTARIVCSSAFHLFGHTTGSAGRKQTKKHARFWLCYKRTMICRGRYMGRFITVYHNVRLKHSFLYTPHVHYPAHALYVQISFSFLS